MDRCRRVADIGKAELRIQPGVVVPGQPVGRVQLTIWQPHHLCEAGGYIVELIDQPLRTDERDRIRALQLHRTTIQPPKARACALARQEPEPALICPADPHIQICASGARDQCGAVVLPWLIACDIVVVPARRTECETSMGGRYRTAPVVGDRQGITSVRQRCRGFDDAFVIAQASTRDPYITRDRHWHRPPDFNAIRAIKDPHIQIVVE